MIKILITFFCTLFASITFHTALAQQPWPGIKDSVYSKVIGETRKIQVILPKDYKAGSDSKYEVLYIMDGEWYMEQTPYIYNYVVSSGFAPENIFVLIPNTYVNGVNIRGRDYSPTKMAEDSLTGGADNYHSFLKNELIPYVEGKYPVNGKRSLIGSSFSGLFAVYAFIKEPTLFQSFIASDPNLVWDNHYVAKLAADKLPGFTDVTSTLFFAGLDVSSKGMGSKGMDSVMRAKAPASLHWKFIEYKEETHFSVQHKAFYDGMRFSHLGYSKTPMVFHPMNGILENGKSVPLIVLSHSSESRYTMDGSEPTASSKPLTERGVVLNEPCELRAKTIAFRSDESIEAKGEFLAGSIPLASGKSKPKPLTYKLYDGQFNALPDVNKLKPVSTGNVDKDFAMRKLKVKADAVYVIDGQLEVDQDGYYIFATNAVDAGKITLGGKKLFDIVDSKDQDIKSFVVPLKKGNYAFNATLLKKRKSNDVLIFIDRTTPQNQNWWDNMFMHF